jgi:[ribosomal protein S5]-alanine N-acetyltransferase
VILTTPRLILRPMRADDVDPLLALFGDPRLMAAFDAAIFDRSRMEAWVRSNLEHQDRFGYGLFTIVERDSGDVIGDCGIEAMEIDGRAESELGYDLRRDNWGRGLAAEAATAVAAYAFAELGLARLISLVRENNRRSARVAEKIGMKAEGRLRRGDVEYMVYAMESPEPRVEADRPAKAEQGKEPVDAA